MKTSFYYLALGILLFSTTAFLPTKSPVSVYLISDSTMADKPGTPEENPERGWGQLLPTFFTEQVVIKNHAVNGRSSKSFIELGHWDKVVTQLKKGDYVFIQFGHNDSKDTDPTRYTNPWSGYRRNLERYVAESRAKGAIPIILSSIVRRKFNDEGVLLDQHGPYPFVARMVAERMEVPFIDHQLLTEDHVIALGPDASKARYLWLEPGVYEKFPEGKQDNTHLTLLGATEFASLVVADMRRQKMALVRFLK